MAIDRALYSGDMVQDAVEREVDPGLRLDFGPGVGPGLDPRHGLSKPAPHDLPGDYTHLDPDQAFTVETEDGGAVVNFGPEEEDRSLLPFDANLADHMEPGDLVGLASELVAAVDADRMSRADWEKTYIKGLDLLGLTIEDRTSPWPGACGVFHPILSEAAIRFQATSIMEVWPAAGPAKTTMVGKPTDEKAKQAIRVQDDLNYFLTDKMTEARAEHERLLFALPLAGAAFKKIYYDPTLGRPVAMFVPAEDFIVPYGATDLVSCPRYTHVLKRYKNDILKLQVAGFYRDLDLPDPAPDYTDIERKRDKLSGDTPSVEYDDRHTLLEIHCDLDLMGFEDPDGVAMPYVVTIDKASNLVLAIRRNWKEEDPRKAKRVWFSQYSYVPGFGFYGLGLVHLIGGIAKSATSILRQLVDAGTLSNLPAGLKARGLRIKGDSSPLMPGEFRDVDVPGGSIRDAITFLPYKEPSQVLSALLVQLVEEGRRFASIADIEIGDANAEAPVGTTLALMERAMKVMSAVQARLHASMKGELRLLAEIIGDEAPAEYEYETDDGATRTKDYDGRVDVLPVSDPSATSMSQRVVQHQAALQLSAQAPGIYDLPELHKEMLTVLGFKNADKLIPSSKDQKPQDPVAENMHILTGKPVKAFLYQDHEAHIAVHMAAVQDPKVQALVGQSPQAQAIMGAAQAHIAEHVGFAYRRQIETQMGVELPDPDKELPEGAELALSKLMAEAGARVLGQNQAEAEAKKNAQAAQDPVIQQADKELAIKAGDLARKREKDNADAALAANAQRIELAKIAAATHQSGAQLGMDAARARAELASKERLAGTEMGIRIAEERQRFMEQGKDRDHQANEAQAARISQEAAQALQARKDEAG